jgi:hypothetical protein
MQKDKTPGRAAHHSSGGRKVPVSAADRAAARDARSRPAESHREVIRTRVDAEAAKDKRRTH